MAHAGKLRPLASLKTMHPALPRGPLSAGIAAVTARSRWVRSGLTITTSSDPSPTDSRPAIHAVNGTGIAASTHREADVIATGNAAAMNKNT